MFVFMAAYPLNFHIIVIPYHEHIDMKPCVIPYYFYET